MNKFLKFILSVTITLSVGAVAGIATSKSVTTWYTTLNAPFFKPPNWLFGPVWTTLYLLLGISFFLIWKESRSPQRDKAMGIFGLQLALNFAWSFIFFYFHQIGLALAEIILLWLTIFTMLVQFHKVKPIAAYMNIPYLLWVSFASVLNGAYFWLN